MTSLLARIARPGRFVVVGVINTLLDFAVFNALLLTVPWRFPGDAALYGALGYGCGVVCSFYLNRHWTFRFKGQRPLLFARFVLFNLVGLGIHVGAVGVASLFLQGPWVNVGKAAAVGIATVWAYVAYERWVFRTPE